MSGIEEPPPSGWYHFGTHAGWDSADIPRMEFSGSGEDGLPLFERPAPSKKDDRDLPDGVSILWTTVANQRTIYSGRDGREAAKSFNTRFLPGVQMKMTCTMTKVIRDE